jgi:hypothetical protein
MGATFNDGIIADFITAGTLYGLLFKAGAIESLDGKINIDLESGNMPIFNTGVQTNNKVVITEQNSEEKVFVVERVNIAGEGSPEAFQMLGYAGGNIVFNILSSETGGAVLGIRSATEDFGAGFACSPDPDGQSGVSYIDVHDKDGAFRLLAKDGNARISLPGDEYYGKRLYWATIDGKNVLCGE